MELTHGGDELEEAEMTVVMGALRKFRCAVRWHRWGAAEAGVHEVHQTCTRCGRTRRLTTAEPPQMHDHMHIHP